MAITRFEDLPSTNTPINSENLNGNFDELGVKVGTSVDNNYRTNIIKGKNKVQPDNIYMQVGLNDNGALAPNQTTRVCIFQVKVKPNTQYTISCASGYQIGNVFQYNESKTYTTKVESDYARSKQYTSNSTTNYISFVLKNTDNTTISTSEISNIKVQVEEGTETSYEPYVTSSIYVDNEKFTETVGIGTSINSANRVNFIKGKNLFNGNSFSNRSAIGVTTTFNNSEITFNGTTSSADDLYTTTYGFYLEAGTYTFKFSRKSGTYTANGGATAIIIKKTGGTRINRFEIGGVVSNPYELFTFTLDSKTQIGIQIYANASNQTFSNLILEVQLEKGSTATTYEPYVTPSIVVDNEEIYTKGQNEVYSTGEIRIGTWIDGKPLYRKVFTITSLTSSNANLVDVSWLSIDFAKISGTIISSDGAKFPINLYDSASNYSVIILSGSGYIRGRGAIGSGTLSKCIVILEYTKTTDA